MEAPGSTGQVLHEVVVDRPHNPPNLVQIDPRARVWVCGDESGQLGLPGSKHFVVTTVTIKDWRITRRLAELKLTLRRRTGGHRIGSVFSAKNDTMTTRSAVFDLLRREDIDIEASYITKSELPPQIWQHPRELYASLWFDHLLHALPSALAPANRVKLLIADFASASDNEAFTVAYGGAAGIAWHPFAMEHLRPDSTGRLQIISPVSVLMKQLPDIRFSTEPAAKQRLLQVADYASWAIQRWLERGDDEGLSPLRAKVSAIRKVTLTRAEECTPGRGRLRSQRMFGSPFGDWQAWFQYDSGPKHSGQADCAVEAAVRCNDPEQALRFFRHVVFGQHIASRRDTLRRYLWYLHGVLPLEQRPLVRSMLGRVIATLVNTELEPDRRILEGAAGLLTLCPPPALEDTHVAVEEAEAGEQLCARLLRDIPGLGPLAEMRVNFTYRRALAYAKLGEHRAARLAYAEVVRRTLRAPDVRMRAIGVGARVNLLTLLPISPFVEETLDGVITELRPEKDSLLAEPFCGASLSLAAIRFMQGRRGEGEDLVRGALRRAQGTQQPWVPQCIERAKLLRDAVDAGGLPSDPMGASGAPAL